MPGHHLHRRALVPGALASLAPLATIVLLACASGNAQDPSPAPDLHDPLSLDDGGGKTIENLFAGRFPGVTVTQTDHGGLAIRVRGGPSSFVASDEPLYVVDETPLPQGTGGIVYVNPYDIERIQILKNPVDIALYGVRGANGVVKITTRRPGVH